MLEKLLEYIKSHALLLSSLTIFCMLVLLFHEVMTPFIIALIVVYLMEPLVKRVNQKGIGKKKFPRWVAVILAYVAFFAAVVGVGFAFIPSLTAEISQATEAIPAYFTRVKTQDIPRWSSNIDKLLFRLSLRDLNDVTEAVNDTSIQVRDAYQKAVDINNSNTLPVVDTSGSQPLLRLGVERESALELDENVTDHSNSVPPNVLFKFVKDEENGGYYLIKGSENIILEPAPNGAYTVKFQENTEIQAAPSNFNLEREFNRIVLEAIEASTHYAGSALSFLQTAIEVIINTFVQFILVFMLGAFISIDEPKFMKTIRKLFATPDGSTAKFDDLLARLNKSLGGVIRGQIIICCINGTLTGIGLWIFDVDFALLLGIIAGVLSIVPIFGTIISTIPAVLLGLVQGFSTAVLVLCWILGVHFLDTNFFTPKIVGKSSSLHPVIIIFALLAGQYAFGALGLILAIPVASICQTLFIFALDQSKKVSSETLPSVADEGSDATNVALDDDDDDDDDESKTFIEKIEPRITQLIHSVIKVKPVSGDPDDEPSIKDASDGASNSNDSSDKNDEVSLKNDKIDRI